MKRNKSGLPDNCTYARDRHGKQRVRFRKNGFSTYLYGTPWGEDFMRAHAAALDGVAAQRGEAGAERTRPGSINALLVHYYRSPEFTGLKPSTQTTYRGILERFRATYGNDRVSHLKREHVKAILGAMSDRPSAANNLKRMLAMVIDFAVDIGMTSDNPARGVKGYRIASSGFHTWTEAEIAAYEETHPLGTKARLAMTLLLYTGQRRGDMVRMGWQHVTPEGRLKVTQEKTGRALAIKMHPRLLEALRALPRDNMTFLTTRYGAAYTSAGFGNAMRDWCNEAGLKQCSAHGLRKAISRRLAEAGNGNPLIKSVTGHVTDKEVARYTRDADQVVLGDAAIDSISGTNGEQKLSNLEDGLDKVSVK